MSLAAVFPGQGSQRLGMARDFYEQHEEARGVFRRASEALSLDVAEICFEDAERLARTEFQQPALLTAELAMLAVLRARHDVRPSYFGGHSLGEYTALAAAGVMETGAAAALVRERGRLMQEAVPLGEGSMTALLRPGLDVERLHVLLAEPEPIDVEIANDNSPDQVVLSGGVGELSRAAQRLKEDEFFGRGRCIPLRVSAPFHSRLMQPAAEQFRSVLEGASAEWQSEPAACVACNLTGEFHRPERATIVDALARQIFSPVRWLDCMRTLVGAAPRIVEIGPGRTLAGFFKGIGVSIENVADTAGAERLSAA